MLKILSTLSLSFLCLTAHAQLSLEPEQRYNPTGMDTNSVAPQGSGSVSKESIKANIKQYTQTTALLLGYANYCKLDNMKIETISNQFYPQLDLLAKDYATEIKKEVLTTFNEAKKVGPQLTNQTCESFAPEFEKIYISILLQNSGVTN